MPNTYKSTIIANNSPAKFGVYPPFTYGSLTLADNTTLGTGDLLNLCLIPANTILIPSSVFLDVPVMDSASALVWDLKDDQASPVTYISGSQVGRTGAGGILTAANLTVANWVNTQYTTQQTLLIKVTTGGGGALAGPVTLYFGFQFAPL